MASSNRIVLLLFLGQAKDQEKQTTAEGQTTQTGDDKDEKKPQSCGLFRICRPYWGLLLALLSALLMTSYTTMIKFLDQMDSMQVVMIISNELLVLSMNCYYYYGIKCLLFSNGSHLHPVNH